MRYFPHGTTLFRLSSFILLRAPAFLAAAAAAAVYLSPDIMAQSMRINCTTPVSFIEQINKQTFQAACLSSLHDRRRSVNSLETAAVTAHVRDSAAAAACCCRTAAHV